MQNVSYLPVFMDLIPCNKCMTWNLVHNKMYNQYGAIYVASLVFCSINILTNSLAFLIFYQDPNKSPLNKLLMVLSVSEVVFQALFITHVIVEKCLLLLGKITSADQHGLYVFGVAYLGVFIPILTCVHIVRNWIIVLVSLYRFEKLVRAFSNNCLVFRESQITAVIATVIICAIPISLPRIIERRIHYSKECNSLYRVCGMGLRGLTIHWYRYGYTIVMLFLFQNGGPIIIVCIVSTLLIHEIRYRHSIHCRLKQTVKDDRPSICSNNKTITSTTTVPNQSRFLLVPQAMQKDTESTFQEEPESTYYSTSPRFSVRSLSHTFTQIRQRHVHRRSNSLSRDGSRLVMILCITFVVCEAPLFFSKFLFGLHSITPKTESWKLFTEYLSETANFVTIIDSFFNFFIYLLSNRSFRNSLRLKLFCKPCRQ